jgi:hypothetical protein
MYCCPKVRNIQDSGIVPQFDSKSNPVGTIGCGISWLIACLVFGQAVAMFNLGMPSTETNDFGSLIFKWAPVGLSVFGVLAIVSGAWELFKKKRGQPVYQEPTESVVNPWAQKSSSSTTPTESVVNPWAQKSSSSITDGDDPEEQIDIPHTCPHCQAAITNEGLEWVGPMTFKCPSCGSTVHAQMRKT